MYHLHKKLRWLLCLWLILPISTAHVLAQPINIEKYHSVEEVVFDVIDEFNFDASSIAIAYTNFETGEHYFLNEDIPMHGASTTKVATAMMFVDLINEGHLSWDTQMPNHITMYEDGGGNITNSPQQSSYPLEEVIYESLFNSDNTAWNILIHYYQTHHGDFQQAILQMSDIANPEGLYEINVVNARVLEGILLKLVANDSYQPIIDIMRDSQQGQFFKAQGTNDMAVKYGRYGEFLHDIGVYFDIDEPVYSLVVMTSMLSLDAQNLTHDFFGTLNQKIYQWSKYSNEH